MTTLGGTLVKSSYSSPSNTMKGGQGVTVALSQPLSYFLGHLQNALQAHFVPPDPILAGALFGHILVILAMSWSFLVSSW